MEMEACGDPNARAKAATNTHARGTGRERKSGPRAGDLREALALVGAMVAEGAAAPRFELRGRLVQLLEPEICCVIHYYIHIYIYIL